MLPNRPKNFNLDKTLDRIIRSLDSNWHLCRADYCILLIRRNEIPKKVNVKKTWDEMTQSEKDMVVSSYTRRYGQDAWSKVLSKHFDLVKHRFSIYQAVTKLFDKYEMHSFEDGLCRLFDLEKFGYVIDQMNNQGTDSIYYQWHLPFTFPKQPNAERCIVIGMHKGDTIDDTNITPDLIERISNSVMP